MANQHNDFAVQDENYKVVAYDSIVTIVEPERSLFDLKTCVSLISSSRLFSRIFYQDYDIPDCRCVSWWHLLFCLLIVFHINQKAPRKATCATTT